MQWYKVCIILQLNGGIKNKKILHLQIDVLPQSVYTYRKSPIKNRNTKDTNFLKRLLICPGKRIFCTTFPVIGVLDLFLIANFTED